MPDLSHTIRKFDRFELKYVAPVKAAEEFKRSLRPYLVPDDHGDSLGSYYLTSLYYDGPDFRFYWEKVDGVKRRRKLRIRHYGSCEPLTESTLVSVEIKQRVDRVTQKRRVVLPYPEALRFCDERKLPDHDPRDAAVIDEINGMLWQYNLRPASIVSYARQALVGTEYDIGLRVTFDRSPLVVAPCFALRLTRPNLNLPGVQALLASPRVTNNMDTMAASIKAGATQKMVL
jgi:hypothetical protein